MSILRKPYEISVWDDVWSTEKGKFVESRLGVIGSNEMLSQNRVIEPELTQNTNGTKKFTFKLYKRYIDNITGEQIENPFYSWLANERKIKLKYDNKWYDFVIKNISEPSYNYLYTYQLEDANIQELSKNGFNFVFDTELQNNFGTSRELTSKLLADTDWEVGNCDIPVQTIDEALVYLSTTGEIIAKQILDQINQSAGISEGNTVRIPKNAVVLATYSSCTSRPHRFQFFYVKDLDTLQTDDNRFIINPNCQYYIDYNDPERDYDNKGGYIIPNSFVTTTRQEFGDTEASGVTLSAQYRGKRYGFTQQSEFVPSLNRYVNLYDVNGKTYYGYENTEYCSTNLINNLISGSQLKSTSGWTGTTLVAKREKASVESVYGRFDASGNFHSSLDDMKSGTFNDTNIKNYKPYLKIEFKDSGSAIINSGPYDNRTTIGKMEVGDEYKIEYTLGGNNTKNLEFSLGEYTYKSTDGGYHKSSTEKIRFSSFNNNISTVTSSSYSAEDFKKDSQVRLCIKGTGIYYLESINLYKVVRDKEGNILDPKNQGDQDFVNTIDTTYYYVDKESADKCTNPDQVVPTTITKNLTYETYKPIYNEGAQKSRTVSAKESNYFNILQSIAETFEQWLDIDVKHDDDGAITEKLIHFRNYIGKENYAGFKYGVNLKDIKRTYESKKLATKLIVKQNSNEFAKNGFCTIARASANPTGETSIYDFQYFFNTGMMSARDYLETTYVVKGNDEGAQGYYPRIRDINININNNTELLLNISKDLVKVNADLEVAKVGREAANAGVEEADERIRLLTGGGASDLNKADKDLLNRSDVKKAIQEYSAYRVEENYYIAEEERLTVLQEKIQTEYNSLQDEINIDTEKKNELNKNFFAVYGRFIQEGTWINEEYTDDEKYYADAQSVLYNSCYPQVAYEVNVIEVSQLPGYEDYAYDLGDTTFVEDKEFFGEDFRVDVVVTETTDHLDDPNKNKIKIQNFKNQFQDLFQKITATVQQTQYSTGSYEKAVALAEAKQERKQQFLTDALDGMSARLAVAGQQSVVIDDSGITVTDVDTPSDSIRMVGGAILLSKQDKNGQQKWTTGMTSDGVSASLITAGTLNAGEIAIMNYDQPAFRWDSFGISAFDADWYDGVVSDTDLNKFIRFDKNGIYGMDGVNGLNWHPQASGDKSELNIIEEKANFALTWSGLKVVGEGDTVAKIGKQADDKIISVTDSDGQETLSVTKDGEVTIAGNFNIGGSGQSLVDYANEAASSAASDAAKGALKDAKDYADGWMSVQGKGFSWNFDKNSGISMSCNDELVFGVGFQGDEYVSYLKGEVVADSGYIGGSDGWKITTGRIESSSDGNEIYISSAGDDSYWIKASSGDLTMFGVTKEGKMEANSGTIGGWELSDTYLKTQKGNSLFWIVSALDASSEYWIGATHNGEDTFSVRRNGTLYARGADIEGTVTATEGSFGSCAIDGGNLVFNNEALKYSELFSHYIRFAGDVYEVFIGVDGGVNATTLRIHAQGGVVFESSVGGRPYLYNKEEGNQLVTQAEMEAAIQAALANNSGGNTGGGGGGNKPVTCLLEGTPITMADGTTKAIEDIQPGDLLQSYNPITKEQTTAVAIESYATGENTDFDVYHFSNGNSAHIYIKHGFYNARTGCVQNLKEITDEDMLLDINGEVVTCARIDTEHFDVPKKRYNLITSNNLYYADNVLLGHSPWFKYKLIQKRNYTIPDDIYKLFKRDLLDYRQFHKYEEQFEFENRSDVEELTNRKAAYFAECFKRDNDAFGRIKDYYTNQSDET